MTSAALLFRRPSPVSSPRVATLMQLPTTYVHPGQVVVSDQPGVLTTILGSCVAVCITDPKARVGGMNHYLLPGGSVATEPATRYGKAAISALMEEMIRLGASPSRMSAQIVGGAAVLAAFGNGVNHLGARNVAIAREMLSGYGVAWSAEDVLGGRGRKLVFSPRDGTTQIHFIGK